MLAARGLWLVWCIEHMPGWLFRGTNGQRQLLCLLELDFHDMPQQHHRQLHLPLVHHLRVVLGPDQLRLVRLRRHVSCWQSPRAPGKHVRCLELGPVVVQSNSFGLLQLHFMRNVHAPKRLWLVC